MSLSAARRSESVSTSGSEEAEEMSLRAASVGCVSGEMGRWTNG